MSAKLTRVAEALERDSRISAVTVNRLKRLCAEYATEDDFFRATKGDLMRVWAKLEPDSRRGIGQSLFDAFSKAKALWATPEVKASLPDPLSRPATTELLLWMASFLEQNNVEQMPFGRLLDIWDRVQEAKK